MPASILPQYQDPQNPSNVISAFFSQFKIGNLLRLCNARKQKGIPVISIFQYKLANVFTGKSIFMQMKEVFFKACKSYLKLQSECHSLSYDALTAHVAVVFTRYILLALEQRRAQDDRTIGELLFYITYDELADMTFQESFLLICDILKTGIDDVFQVTDEQIEEILRLFTSRLPNFLKRPLSIPSLCA